ncbi:MAG TPA: hypothetical protein VHW65_10505 [Gemmatimonadales bacterium]|jgi:hypothetical protein|nr:hypothetical protein [Gemmatimonadales bacterium]
MVVPFALLSRAVEDALLPDTMEHVLAIAASVSVIIGVIVALLQLRSQGSVRQAELAIKLYSSFGEEGFVRHFNRVLHWQYPTYEAYRDKHEPEDYTSLMVVSVFFENMGLLLKRGLAPIDLLDDLLSGPVLAAWPKVRPIWDGLRDEHDQQSWAEWFEFLYKAMARREGKL